MVSAHDVAKYILEKQGPMTAMKLQKLVYYCQAWSLVWDDEPLFHEKIEAWANGPVVRELYNEHKGMYQIENWQHGNSRDLNSTQKETISAVLDYYGDKSSQWLSDLTYKEHPWRDARRGLSPDDRGTSEIGLASMHDYYSRGCS